MSTILSVLKRFFNSPKVKTDRILWEAKHTKFTVTLPTDPFTDFNEWSYYIQSQLK